jgi:hypothetical protein
MVRTKFALLGLCVAIIGTMAMYASTAQGSTLSWLILNSTHTTATELSAEVLAKTDSSTIKLNTEVTGLTPLIVCSSFAFAGVLFIAVGEIGPGALIILASCKVVNHKGEEYKCTVKSSGAVAGTIQTNKLKGKLVLVGSELLTKIEPESGPTGNFATIRFEGAECPLPESNQLHGTLYLKDAQGFATTHKLEHLFESASSTALYIGGHSAKQLEVTKIVGSIWVSLGGAHKGLEWSGMDV